MATEDLCLVCADSLDYTGFGPCGHKDVCSRCVARQRFVMEDSKCMLCKQECPRVFFTRYMGDYTEGLAPDEFENLPARAREVWELPEVSGYFDDQDHYKAIKGLCSYTHPMLPGAMFGNLNSLKRKLQEQHKLHYCDLCIKGRKVFISEQVLYSKSDLERHMRTGDDEGPMAESGFKGHPLCRFCRQRFYDGDELYKHMEGRHEHCFICRRRDPNKFVYYKDYAELEEHFTAQHHPCPHPACLERKFVVFQEEPELKRHFATEHGGEMNLSRAQRRNLLSVNIQLNYAREQEEAAAAAGALARPGVVIGGGHNLPRRGAMRHSRSEGAMAAALAASVESNQVESVMRRSAAEASDPGSVTFSAEDFPTVSGQGSGAAPLGTWIGASGGPGGSASLRQEDFPALPTMSRNQRRKQRERAAASAGTLAGRLAAAGAPIRVVNRAAPGTGSSNAATDAGSSSGGGLVRQSSSTGNLPAAAAAAAAAADSQMAAADDSFVDAEVDASTGRDDFPALSGGAPSTQAHPAWVPVRRSGKPPRSGQAAGSSSGSSSRAAPSISAISDFPSLAATVPASSRHAAAKSGKAAASRPAAASRGSSSSSSSGAQSVAAAVAAAGGVSEELKAANKALIERCKALLSEAGFKEFREQSGAFMQGGVSAGKYHTHCVQHSLTSLVPQLAALCPDADKRAALITAHKQYLEDSQGSLSAAAAGGRGWVPPEAALAALQEVESKGSWTCERCTLTNAPSSRSCEVCSAPKPKPGAAAAAAGKSAAQRAAAGSSSSSSAAAAQRPSQWQQAAAAGGGGSNAGGGSGSSTAVPMAAKLRASAALPARPPAAPAAAPPPVPSGGESWPTLAGPSSGRSSRSDSGTSSPVPQQQQASSGAASSSSAAQEQQLQPGKKKKGTKTSLQELLQTGKSHPQNAWSQTQRLEAVTAPSGGGGRWSMGQWGKQGGNKLAKKINAVNDAWGS